MRRALRWLGTLMLLAAVGIPLQHPIAAPPAVASSSGSPSTSGFAEALEPRHFEFPRDHGPHPDFRLEWWYVTGNLDAAGGERFGFELTFFRVALVPATPVTTPTAGSPAVPSGELASAWRTREIYVAHFAVTDVARRRFRSEQKLSRAALGLAGSEAEPLHVWLDDWALKATGDGTGWQLHATQPGYSLDLVLEPQSAPMLNGKAGLSRKSDRAADATYYYSIPRLEIGR